MVDKYRQDYMKGIILAVSGAGLWGVMGVFTIVLANAGLGGLDIAFLRCLLAGVGYLIFKAVTQLEILKIDLPGLFICLCYGLSAYALGFAAYNVSVERIPVSVATVLMFMSPIWVVVLGALVFREQPSGKTLLVILICIAGAALVSNTLGGTADGPMDKIGIFAGILNGFTVALQIMIPRYFARRYQRDTLLVYGFLGAALGMCPFIDFHAIGVSLTGPEGLSVLISILVLGFLCTMVANVAVVKATQFINTTTCSILSSLEVVVGALVGVFILHEHLSLFQVLGAVIVVCASIFPVFAGGRDKT